MSLEKGILKRYSDGAEVQFSLATDPFFRTGQHGCLIYRGNKLIGLGKLETQQWVAISTIPPEVSSTVAFLKFVSISSGLVCAGAIFFSLFTYGMLLTIFISLAVSLTGLVYSGRLVENSQNKDRKKISETVAEAAARWTSHLPQVDVVNESSVKTFQPERVIIKTRRGEKIGLTSIDGQVIFETLTGQKKFSSQEEAERYFD
jgi:hypothetical protein